MVLSCHFERAEFLTVFTYQAASYTSEFQTYLVSFYLERFINRTLEDTNTILIGYLFGTQVQTFAYRSLVSGVDIIRVAHIYRNCHAHIG